jgi:hypothetical protein
MDHINDDRMSYDELREFEPCDWSGRQLVEQDNTDDWGAWLSQFDGWLQDVLQDVGKDVEPLAIVIAEAYIAGCNAPGYPMPADCDETGDSEAAQAVDDAAIAREFCEYLRTWQAAIARIK